MSTQPIPRDPSAYRPGMHFIERFKDIYDRHNRHLDGDIVETCIREGDAERDGATTFKLESDIDGVRYRIVVDVHLDRVVSGYPTELNEQRARDSGRWSAAQLADIREFLAAKAE